jgi:hypothetical protein
MEGQESLENRFPRGILLIISFGNALKNVDFLGREMRFRVHST